MKVNRNPEISVVIPVYNTDLVLEELTNRLEKTLTNLKLSFEIIFVDDCSPNENTWPRLRNLATSRSYCRAFRLTRNFGQQNATLAGFNQTRGEYVLTMDDDLQHQPEDIPKLWGLRDHDAVIGFFPRKKHGLFKRTGSKIKAWFDFKILGKPKNIQLTAFRLCKKFVVESFKNYRTPRPFIPAILFYVTKDIVNIPVSHAARDEGRSGYSIRKMVSLFSNLLINNSAFLLHMVAGFGFILSVLSFGYGIYIVIAKLFFNQGMKSWPSLMTAIVFFGGAILLTLGIIGEYLARIIATQDGRPPYIIGKKIE